MDAAYKAGEKMAVIFSDAAYNSENLLLWGVLQKIEIDGERTNIQFTDVKRIPGRRHRTELKLKSTGKEIAPNFIRPHAIC